MRRIAIALILVAAVVGIHACAADAPSAPKPGSGGGTTSSALSVQLFTSDANPKAGTCTLVEAIVTLNGTTVPDGTSVNFSTDFGTFGQSGTPLVSVVTTNGSAVTALCGPGAGTAKMKAQATSAGKSNSANLSITFQPDSSTLPFVSFCSPSSGPKTGSTPVILNGGRFFGSPSTTRVTFNANGISKDAIVTAVTSTQISVLTPSFIEVGSPTIASPITVILGTNVPTPVVLSLPSCFVYGADASGNPVVTAVLPASGLKAGGTRVTIVGSGFSTTGGVQVFFGDLASTGGRVEATVVSVSYNQVVVLSPPAPFGTAGDADIVSVIVKNIASGAESDGAVHFTYTADMHITGINNNTQSTDQAFKPVTIFGTGFASPLAVTLGGVAAFVQSVSATELVVMPALPLNCSQVSGSAVVVTNLATGETANNPAVVFNYVIPAVKVLNVSPNTGAPGITATITGSNLPAATTSTAVTFGGNSAIVQSASPTAITVTVPPATNVASPSCGLNPAGTILPATPVDVTVTNVDDQCAGSLGGAYTYLLPCVLP